MQSTAPEQSSGTGSVLVPEPAACPRAVAVLPLQHWQSPKEPCLLGSVALQWHFGVSQACQHKY